MARKKADATPAVPASTKRKGLGRGHGLGGQPSLFRHKRRETVTLTLTDGHHEKVERAVLRLGLTRADLIGLLIDLFADTLMQGDVEKVRKRLARGG